MKALLLNGVGFENFRLGECETPRAAAGQVLLKMRAAAVGLRDYKQVTGAYASDPRDTPLIPGGEGVGVVVEIGAGVEGIQLGERVNPVFCQGWVAGRPHPATLATGTLGGPVLQGCFGEYLAVRADGVVRVAEHLSDAEAATLPFAGLGAWRTIHEQGRLCAGDTVLIQGTGGIPLFALQFAKQLGATVIVTSKSDEKLERAQALGADHIINYATTPDWAAAALEITGGVGADLVLDPGGTITMNQSTRAVRPGGVISVFTALGSAELGIQLPYLLGHNIQVMGVNAGSRASHEAMMRAVAAGRLKPVIESLADFADGVAAVARAPKADQFGKTCLQFIN